jgi:hypothetical protein
LQILQNLQERLHSLVFATTHVNYEYEAVRLLDGPLDRGQVEDALLQLVAAQLVQLRLAWKLNERVAEPVASARQYHAFFA